MESLFALINSVFSFVGPLSDFFVGFSYTFWMVQKSFKFCDARRTGQYFDRIFQCSDRLCWCKICVRGDQTLQEK